MDVRENYEAITEKLLKDLSNINVLHELIPLYESAVKNYDYDIADSIALYITDLGDKETVKLLEKEIKKSSNDDISKAFQEWINHLNNFKLKTV